MNVDASKFRQIAARANYLAMDRPDIMYAVKELCRYMSKPRVQDWRALKRLGRYLINHMRIIIHYPWQGNEDNTVGYTDSDWGGCPSTGRSTSGGVLLIGVIGSRVGVRRNTV